MLQTGMESAGKSVAALNPGMLNSLTVADSSGVFQTLYFDDGKNTGVPLAYFDMPPLPPTAAFDARFESPEGGSLIGTFSEKKLALPITIQSDRYPVTISWKVCDKQSVYTLLDGSPSPKIESTILADEGTMKIADPLVHRLVLQAHSTEELPTQFSLSQNYPNPFNPETRIHFELPHDGPVTLAVYDVLGREVRMLLNENRVAGRYDVRLDARGMASGVYFYRLSTPGFTGIRKLMVLK